MSSIPHRNFAVNSQWSFFNWWQPLLTLNSSIRISNGQNVCIILLIPIITLAHKYMSFSFHSFDFSILLCLDIPLAVLCTFFLLWIWVTKCFYFMCSVGMPSLSPDHHIQIWIFFWSTLALKGAILVKINYAWVKQEQQEICYSKQVFVRLTSVHNLDIYASECLPG